MTDRPVSPTNPSHYRSHPSGVECIDVIRHMSYSQGNAIKYCWRAGMKDDDVQDLSKALWYVNDCLNSRVEIVSQPNNLYTQWNTLEPEGIRKQVIKAIYEGSFNDARQGLEAWIESIGRMVDEHKT